MPFINISDTVTISQNISAFSRDDKKKNEIYVYFSRLKDEWISIYDYRFIQRRLLVESRIIETTARYDRI